MLPLCESPGSLMSIYFSLLGQMSFPEHVTPAVTAIRSAQLSEQSRFAQWVLRRRLHSVINASALSRWKKHTNTELPMKRGEILFHRRI